MNGKVPYFVKAAAYSREEHFVYPYSKAGQSLAKGCHFLAFLLMTRGLAAPTIGPWYVFNPDYFEILKIK